MIWGSADQITARVSEHLDAGADQVALTILNSGGQPGPIDVARELAGQASPLTSGPGTMAAMESDDAAGRARQRDLVRRGYDAHLAGLPR